MPGSPENPEVLPRAALLGSASRARLETLLELRDEACYLGLEDLYRLCCEQISQRYSLSRDVSSSTSASIRSLHTVIEQVPSNQEVQSSRLSSVTAKSEPGEVPCHGARSASRIQGVGRKSPPPGWI